MDSLIPSAGFGFHFVGRLVWGRRAAVDPLHSLVIRLGSPSSARTILTLVGTSELPATEERMQPVFGDSFQLNNQLDSPSP
jgi:hypothetical protein